MSQPKSKEDMLQVLREFFLADDVSFYEKTDMWDILTALRGPDRENTHAVKSATTAVIRQAVFGPDFIKARDAVGATMHVDNNKEAKLRRSMDADTDAEYGPDFHFRYHARRAFTALGLNWTGVN